MMYLGFAVWRSEEAFVAGEAHIAGSAAISDI